ncbi:sulfotransferase [Candidatus Albibeggiatoa sp. nov. NOAA]|uniref:sulfotransferase n=1 Tax=Candidatus Albibeggiatoa sp. nov. NOAA TaxID=3162724 RepID=UPI0032F6ED1F|nr:hypothetical protein [Thiotrichaceae bacterium]
MQNANQHAKLGLTYQHQNQLQKAAQHYYQAIELDANQPAWVYASFGSLLLKFKQIQKAEHFFKFMQQQHPNEPYSYIGAITLFVAQKRWEQVLDQCQRCLQKIPFEINCLSAKADALFKLGRYTESKVIYLFLIKHDLIKPNLAIYHRLIKEITFVQNDLVAAKYCLDKALQQFPENAFLNQKQFQLAQYFNSLDQPADTIENLSKKYPTLPIYQVWLNTIQRFYDGEQRIEHLHKLLTALDKVEHVNNEVEFLLLKINIYLALKDYEVTRSLIEDLRKLDCQTPICQSLFHIQQKLKVAHFPNYNAPKIFGIGLSRTGTTSLTQALDILGFHTAHWINPHTDRELDIDDVLLFDALTDISISYMFETLYEKFPNAKFIYTTRPLDSWEKSVKTHYLRNHFSSDLKKLIPITNYRNQTYQNTQHNIYSNHTSWREAYLHFDTRVKTFFADKPQDKFLEFNIFVGDDWHQLCEFLGCDRPTIDFPWKNKT